MERTERRIIFRVGPTVDRQTAEMERASLSTLDDDKGDSSYWTMRPKRGSTRRRKNTSSKHLNNWSQRAISVERDGSVARPRD